MIPFNVVFPHKEGKNVLDLEGVCLSVERRMIQKGEHKTELFVYSEKLGFVWLDASICTGMDLVTSGSGGADLTKEVVSLVKEIAKIKESLKDVKEKIKKLNKK